MRRFLDAALRLADRGTAAVAIAGGLLIFSSALIVSFDVTTRKLFNYTLGGADELSGYALAIGSAWAFAYVLLNRGNVRIDVLYQHLPRGIAALCDIAAVLALLAFVGVTAWYGWGVVAQSWTLAARSNSALGVPLWIPQGMWWLGYAWLLSCGALLLVRGLILLFAADLEGVHRLLGARSVEDEAADELAHASSVVKRQPLP
jgi:TRAP-type C4-dicarboxylate transport system permease small subunit